MSKRTSRLRAVARAIAQPIANVFRIALILALVFLPVPVVTFLAAAFVQRRDEPPAEIHRDQR